MSEYSKDEPTTHEEGVKFGLIIGSIISNCEALFSEKFEGYELKDFLRTIGLGEFSSGDKRLDGSLWLKYDGYKRGRDVTNITLLCSELWLYTSPNTREGWGDVFTEIPKLKIKYKDNSSLCRTLDSLHMSLMCFVEANQLYCMTRELKRTKTDLVGTKDELENQLNKCSVHLRLMREGLSYENAVYVSEVLGIKKEDDLIYVGVKDIDSLDMPSTEKSKFRTICLNYKSDGECTFIKYLRKNGFCQMTAMFISQNLGIQLVERLSAVTQDDIAKLNLSDDDRTLLLMIWRNYMNELRSEVDSGDLEKIETPRGVYFLLQQLKSE